MKRILLYLTCVLALNAQTRVDLRSQAKSVDFTEAQSTRPIKTGAALPATCVTGDMYLMTSAPAGRNLYACTAANTWSMQAASELPEMTGQANKVLVNDGTSSFWQEAAGDVIGNIADLLVTRLRGRPISSAAPSDGQALIWDADASKWVPRDITLAQTSDLTAKRTSATVLTIGETCTTSNPCRVRVGTQERVFTSAPTVTVLSGTGEMFGYITEERDLTIGYNGTLNLSCTACTTVPNVFAIPSTALSLFRWSVSERAGEWDAAGTDMRSILTSPAGVLPGTGIVITDDASNGSHVVSLDTTVALTKASAQTGQALYCSASGTSGAYLCAMNPQLAIYTTGMTVHFRAHVSSAGGATLDIDGLGAKMLLRSDGSEPAAGEFLSGGHYLLLYDGTAFRASGVLPPSPVDGSGGSQLDGMVPTRSSSTVLTVSAGGWRPGGLSGVSTFAGGDITAISGSGSVLWCLGTDQAYVGATGTLDVAVPAGTNDLGIVTACPDNTIEWWRWKANDVAGQFDVSQGSGNDKRYSATSPAPCTSTATVTATRNPITGACEYTAISDVFDSSVVQLVDDFGFGTTSTGNIGTLGWSISNAAGSSTSNHTTSAVNHPGVSYISSGAADDNGGCITQNAGSSLTYLKDFTASGNWRNEWIIRTTSDLADYRMGVGFVNLGLAFGTSAGMAANNGRRIMVEFDASDSDTVFRFRQCDGTSCTTGNSTVSVSPGAWYKISIQSATAGAISYSVNDEIAVTLTGTMPTFDASPAGCVWTNTAAVRSLFFDRFAFRMTRLTR